MDPNPPAAIVPDPAAPEPGAVPAARSRTSASRALSTGRRP